MKHLVIIFYFFFSIPFSLKNIEKGEILFLQNCNVCHPNGGNKIIPEKTLDKRRLESNGLDSIESIAYQIINGKNGMPSFADRLKEEEIQQISEYTLFDLAKNFEK